MKRDNNKFNNNKYKYKKMMIIMKIMTNRFGILSITIKKYKKIYKEDNTMSNKNL